MLRRTKTIVEPGIHAADRAAAHATALREAREMLEAFLQVREVDMKWLFDHLRNYGIAGTLLYASRHVASRPSAFFIPHFNDFASAAFALISIVLFLLNFAHGGVAYKKCFGRPRLWIYAVLSVVWFLLMAELMEVRVDPANTPVPQIVSRQAL
jgi:hypothetical protein